MAIERRARKEVNLHSEQRRYTLCCERIQGIVQELSQKPGVLPTPVVWPSHSQNNSKIPSARSYLAVMDVIGGWMSRSLSREEILQMGYVRFSTVFFPPEHAAPHLKSCEFIANRSQVHHLFERAARDAALENSPFTVSAAQCQEAFRMRYELLKTIAAKGYGLVDVLELV
ncbi:MAG TPA: hypothetical protein VMX56_05675 [Anaerolineales bacterium]|nr:hypothetical protein [Anaerolineales bacterium]